jgi:elongation factor Tu
MNPHRPPDAKVMFRLTSPTFDGKEKRVRSGYRPVYDIRADYWTSTHHEFLNADEVVTGAEAPAHVWFITPDVYPHTLWVGRVLTVAEGSRPVGTATVLEILNPLLQRNDA